MDKDIEQRALEAFLRHYGYAEHLTTDQFPKMWDGPTQYSPMTEEWNTWLTAVEWTLEG